jgi:hypothetical protein
LSRSPAGAGKRLLWFVALWAAGVAAVGALATVIKLAIGA